MDAKSPILYFRYPTLQVHGIDYVRREVKLEMGTLTDQQSTGRYPIAPMVVRPVCTTLFRHGQVLKSA